MRLQFLMFREWRARPGRAILTLLSVAFAVATVLGTAMAQSMVRRAYATLTNDLGGPPALDIIAAEGGRFSLADVPAMEKLPGIRAIAPMSFRATLVRAGAKRWKAVVLGLGKSDRPVWPDLKPSAGRRPKEIGECLIDASVAESLHIEVPGPIIVFMRRGIAHATVVGAAPSSSLRSFGDGATLVVSLETAERWFGNPGQVDRVRIFADTAAARDSLKSEIAKVLPAGLAVQEPVAQVRSADEILRSSELALRFAGGLAWAMATFIILNTLQMNFTERRWQFSVMRAIGATSRQIGRLVFAEGLWFGCLGALLGIPAGIALAVGLNRAMERLLEAPTAGHMSLAWPSPRAMVLGACVGPLGAVLAAWLISLQSKRLSPLAGITGIEPVGLDRYPFRAVLMAAVVWLIALACLVAVAFQWLPGNMGNWVAILAGLAMLVAFILVIPAVLRPIVGGLSRLMPSGLKAEGFLAARQMQRRSTRTGLTVGVLVVALASGLGLGHAILDNVDDVRRWYRRSMSGDFFLQALDTSSPAAGGAIEKQILDQIRQVDGVASVSTLRFRAARAAGEPVMCIARSYGNEPTLPWGLGDSASAAVRRKLAEGQAVISLVLSQRLHVGPGDPLRLEVQGRVFQRPIAAVVNDYLFGGLAVFLDSTEAARLFDVGPADIYLVTCHGNPPPTAEAALRSITEGHGLALRSFADLRRHLDGLINGIVASLFGLMALGFVVGGFGVGNTMAMSVLETTHEIGLLRITGMTRRQVQRFVLVQGLLVGVVGALLGTLSGVTTAIVIHFCNSTLLGHPVPFEVHSWLLFVNVGGALATAMLAAWGPGRRAARTQLLTAIAYE